MLGQQGQGDKAIKRGKELLRFLENHLEQLIDDYKEQGKIKYEIGLVHQQSSYRTLEGIKVISLPCAYYG